MARTRSKAPPPTPPGSLTAAEYGQLVAIATRIAALAPDAHALTVSVTVNRVAAATRTSVHVATNRTADGLLRADSTSYFPKGEEGDR
jgi:hypothetical protein